jgi:hypothetical protein
MVSHLEILDDILDCLDKAEGRTLPFSFLLKTSGFSRRKFLYLLDNLEQASLVSHTTDFWGDPKSYTLLISVEDIKRSCTIY